MKFSTIFLDRDGVINRKLENDYVKNWDEFEFLPGVKAALAQLTAAQHRLIIITNQRGISRGIMSEEDVKNVHQKLCAEVAASGANISGIYFCPHDNHQCSCRKPDVGMFLNAYNDFPEIDFATSVMIGDSLTDLEAGSRVGCATIFINPSSKLLVPNPNSFNLLGEAESLIEATTKYLL
jgi:D-glycero-D-manno-heptose 1,7-bisphosphate phosphatase